MKKKSEYYLQGLRDFTRGASKCAYAPMSMKGMEWADGYADAECAMLDQKEEILPTLDDAKKAAVLDACEIALGALDKHED